MKIESVILAVIVLAVLLFLYFRKKSKMATAETSVESASSKIISPESEPESIVKEPIITEAVEISDVTDVVPGDSTLRRHYLQNLVSQAESSGDVAVVSDMAAFKDSEISAIEDVAVVSRSASVIPEDVVLKRHFIQQLRSEIEAKMPARPSDSTLKRHYDAQLLSVVASKLDALK